MTSYISNNQYLLYVESHEKGCHVALLQAIYRIIGDNREHMLLKCCFYYLPLICIIIRRCANVTQPNESH